MKSILIHFIVFCFICTSHAQKADSELAKYSFKADNPVTKNWLLDNISKEHPRIIFNPERLKALKNNIGSDKVISNYYALSKNQADKLCASIPVLERKKTGKRLLSVSREAINRMVCLALAANIEKDNQKYIIRLSEELLSVSKFSDWNPSHFLDVAEMSLAVAIGIDWCYKLLPEETIRISKAALLEKGLKAGDVDPDKRSWSNTNNNWNQVCNGGMTAAAIILAEDEPELSAKTIARSLKNLPKSLDAYYPDGVYPEGVSYWYYATYYSAFMIEMCETAFGTDFNLMKSPGFEASALFAKMAIAPSGKTYNFCDCGSKVNSLAQWSILAWFDIKKEVNNYYDKNAFSAYLKKALEENKNPGWIYSIPVVWMSEISKTENISELPEIWVGHGINPVGIYRLNNDNRGFYFGAKGGRGSLNHGNMDVGSFVYELDGVRWAVDLGMQSYNDLEQIMGGSLWGRSQDSRRWELISKNSYCHNTLTVNGKLHNVDAFSDIIEENNKLLLDLTPLFDENTNSVSREISKLGKYGVRVVDKVETNENTKEVIWQFLTQAECTIGDNMVKLKQNGKELNLSIKKPLNAKVRIVSLDPPPLEYDMKVKGLKRIEIVQTNNSESKKVVFDVLIDE